MRKEYEENKKKLREYRKRNKDSKLVELLCKIIEWFNEHCIKDN